MRKLIAIAGADFHIHDWKQYNNARKSRLINSVMPILRAHKLCCSYKVPFLFAGDWFHNWSDVENETNTIALNTFEQTFGKTPDISFIAIPGNHDMSEKNSPKHRSPTHLDAYTIFQNFWLLGPKNLMKEPYKKMGEAKVFINKNTQIFGIPYYNNEHDTYKEIKRLGNLCNADNRNILLLHTDLPGAITSTGYQMESEHLRLGIFKPFDLVLCGHIHKPQKIKRNIIMMGSPGQQTVADMGIKMGLWKIYDDMSVKFIRLRLPKFIQLKEGEEDRGDGNYYIPYKTILASEEEITGDFNISRGKDKLARQYCKVKKIKNKAKRNALIEVLNKV